LVVAAWDPELQHFREHLAARRAASQRSVGDHSEVELQTAAVGVGLVEASLGAMRAFYAFQPSHALFIGTCGVFRVPDGSSTLEWGDAIAPRRVHLVDVDAVCNKSAFPGPMPREALFDEELRDQCVRAGAKAASAANPLTITTDDARANALARASGCEVEHLEVFAFARACAVCDIRGAAILGIANDVGASGRSQWATHHLEASARAADVALAVVHELDKCGVQ